MENVKNKKGKCPVCPPHIAEKCKATKMAKLNEDK